MTLVDKRNEGWGKLKEKLWHKLTTTRSVSKKIKLKNSWAKNWIKKCEPFFGILSSSFLASLWSLKCNTKKPLSQKFTQKSEETFEETF